MKKITRVFLFWFVISCSKEEQTNYIAFLNNITTHSIQLKPYNGGLVPANKIINLSPNSTLQIANGAYIGIGPEVVFLSNYFKGADSIVVVYHNLYPIVHYANPPAVLNPKHYLFASLRNVGNTKSYTTDISNPSSNTKNVKFTFHFTEQDYLDAK